MGLKTKPDCIVKTARAIKESSEGGCCCTPCQRLATYVHMSHIYWNGVCYFLHLRGGLLLTPVDGCLLATVGIAAVVVH